MQSSMDSDSYSKNVLCNTEYPLAHSRNKGVNDQFSELLSQYTLEERFKAPLTDMLKVLLYGGHKVQQCIKGWRTSWQI